MRVWEEDGRVRQGQFFGNETAKAGESQLQEDIRGHSAAAGCQVGSSGPDSWDRRH